MWVSFDDGDHWSSLRLNMPATSIRDLIVKDDDIAVGTHGRSFWILDDIAALRQITAATALDARHALQAGVGVSLSLEQVSRHADSARRAVRPESAGRRDHRLLPGHGRAATRRSRSSSRPAGWFDVFQSRYVDGAGGHRQHAALLDSPDAGACPRRPAFIGSCGICTTRRPPARAGSRATTRSRRRRTTRRASPRAVGGSGSVHRATRRSAERSYSQTLTIRMDPRVKTPPAAIAQEHAMAMSLFDAIALDSARRVAGARAARPIACRSRTQRR